MSKLGANDPDRLVSLLAELRKAYSIEDEPKREPVIEEFVYSFLLWDCTPAKADLAQKRIEAGTVDLNALRVSLAAEVVEILGERYPRCPERSERLCAALNEIYLREHAVSLDRLQDMPKREAKLYLDTVIGTPQYVAARVILRSLGGHAIPVDDRLLELLVMAEVVEAHTPVEKAASFLERHIKSAEGAEAHALLIAWTSDTKAASETIAERIAAGRGQRGGPKKKSATRSKKKVTG